MFRVLPAAVAVLACVAGAAWSAPLEAYGRLPSLENVVLSHEGDRLAFVTSVGAQRTVVIQSLTPRELLATLPAGAEKLRSLQWVDRDHLMITTSVTAFATNVIAARDEYSIGWIYDVKRRRMSRMLERPAMRVEVMNIVTSTPQARIVDGRPVIYATGIQFPSGGEGIPALFSMNLQGDDPRIIEGDSAGAEQWLIDDHGKPVAEADYDARRKFWSLRVKRGGAWPQIYGVAAPIDRPEMLGLTADGQSVLVGATEGGQNRIRPISLSTGTWGPDIEADRGVDRIIYAPGTRRAIGAEILTTQTEYDFFDPKDQAVWDNIAAAFPGDDVSLVSMSDDRTKLVVEVQGQTHGVVYELVDVAANAITPIDQAYAGVGPADVAKVKAITYAAADGQRLFAYLTLPNDGRGKGLPLVVLPHGGPAARDEPGFDWWSQALASRGYAVLQPEFRGSDGYGADLMAAGYGQWGRKMQTDLSDGVRALAANGTIDPKRVCIVGASYGGYAALAGAALDPGVYRCAVSVAGLSDLKRFLSWQSVRQGGSSDNTTLRYWDRFMGAKDPNDPALDQISPIKRIDKVSIPILLIHGKDDTVVPFEQSQLMADALTRSGRPVQFVVLPGEDHWLSRSETRLQMLQATVKFLEANNPPG